MSSYMTLRGRCKELSEAYVREHPGTVLVRGHYLCFAWGWQPHWWVQEADGTIVDPTAEQFPSGGAGEYRPFDGLIECRNCGESFMEGEGYDAEICSYGCYGQYVM